MRKFNQKYLQNWENVGRRFFLLVSCKNVSKMRQKVVPNWSQNASIWGLWGTFGDAILHLLCMSPQSALKAFLKEPKSSPKASSKHPQSIPQAFRKLCRMSPRGTGEHPQSTPKASGKNHSERNCDNNCLIDSDCDSLDSYSTRTRTVKKPNAEEMWSRQRQQRRSIVKRHWVTK